MGKFKIPSIYPTTQKAIRFPNNMIERIEKVIAGKNCTFSAFVLAAVDSALEEVEKEMIDQIKF